MANKIDLAQCKCGGTARVRRANGYLWVECKKCMRRTGYYLYAGHLPETVSIIENEVRNDWNNRHGLASYQNP